MASPTEYVVVMNESGTEFISPATVGKQDKMFNAERLAGLTFAEIINTASFFETDWFDARSIPWLTFKGEIPATSAFTATLTSSTAVDPDSPAAEDFTSISEATVGGTAVGGANNTPTFSFAGESWVKLKLTNLTGSNHAVKVVTKGTGQPGTPAIIPIGADITRDYGAALTRAVVMGVNETTQEPANIKTDDNSNLFTRSVPDRASQAPGRTRFQVFQSHITANATLVAAPGAGKRIIVTNYILTALNISTVAMGQFILRQTDATGTIIVPHSMPTAVAGLTAPILPMPPGLSEPLVLDENMALFMHFAAGTMTVSIAATGYIEDL